MISGLKFSQLAPKQLEEASRLYHHCWHKTQAPLQNPMVAAVRSEQFFRNRLVLWLDTTITAQVSDQVVGIVCWEANMLEALFVSDAWSRRSVGASLLAMAEVQMVKEPNVRLRLDCLVGNFTARHFYECHGWQVVQTLAHTTDAMGGSVEVIAWLMEKDFQKCT